MSFFLIKDPKTLQPKKDALFGCYRIFYLILFARNLLIGLLNYSLGLLRLTEFLNFDHRYDFANCDIFFRIISSVTL